VSQNKILKTTSLENPKFVKPIKIHFSVDGTQREWEAVEAYDSVAILLWHETKRSFILVKQFRAPIFNSNKKDGMMYELCAGIVDKPISNIEIAKEEILEECGYDIPLENIEKITSFYTCVGISGTEQTLYYATCDETMQCSNGGGTEEESIEVVYIPIGEAKNFLFDESYQKTSGLMMAFYWFFDNINV